MPPQYSTHQRTANGRISRTAGRLALGLAATVTAAAALCAASADAGTQSLQVRAAANAQATLPLGITATGEVGVPSMLAIYSEFGGTGCAGQAADEAARGGHLIDQRTVSGPFAVSVAFTPAAPGAYSICSFLDGSNAGVSEHQNQAFSVAVGPAPAPPMTVAPRPDGPTPATSGAPLGRCVVPALHGHSLAAAEHRLSRAGCKTGRIYLPRRGALAMARRRAGGRPLTLVVSSQTPAAGTIHTSGYTVGLRLAVGPAPGTARARRRP